VAVALELLAADQVELLDRYQLIGRLAAGGMATVYLGRIAGVGGFQRFVAIKQLHPHLAHEIEFVEMFLDEARLAAGIHHRNVVPILEIGTTEAGYYLVMEYIEGVTLARLVTNLAQLGRPLPQPILLRIVSDVLSGLHAAHEHTDERGHPLGVVHRDCSPQNILVGLDGCTRITDFGIARASARLASTRDGAMKGKLAYMAPEQTQGETLDRRADLFSVGVVLWELCAGRRLFKGTSDAQTLTRLLADPIPRLREVRPEVQPALDALCHRALERDPERRFQTAAAMADALEQAARGIAGGESGELATERAVESFMREVYGKDFSELREGVRSWLASRPSSSGLTAPTDRDWLPPVSSARRPPPPPSSRRGPPPPASHGEADRPSAHTPTPPLAVEDDAATRVRGRSSTTAVTSGPGAPSDPETAEPTSTWRSSDVAQRGRHRRATLVAAALGIALVVGTFAALRSVGGGAPTAPGATSSEAPSPAASVRPSEPSAAPAATSAPTSATAAPSAPAATGVPARAPSQLGPRASPAPPAVPQPAPAKPPGGVDKDLANPYR
jgi:serine/threonine-protein kinase